MRGRCVKRDLCKARLWLTRAAKLGDARATWELGYRFVSGDGGWARDDARGRGFLEQYLETEPEDCDALYWLARSYGRCWAEAMPIYRKLYERERDSWSAYRIVTLKLAHRRWFAPEEFAEMNEMLRMASRKEIFSAGRLLHSSRWRHYRETLMTSEKLAAKYRRSLRWGDGCSRYACDFHGRGGRKEFELASRYLASANWLDVIVGADLLGQLGYLEKERPFAEESTALLCEKMPTVQTDDERRCILLGIAWQHTESGRAFLLRYAYDPNAELRHIVAWGLYGENREELDALLKLAHDPEEEVWDWAVFNLISVDGELYPELQEGLSALAGHSEFLMRYQAIAALAARHASNAEALLRAELAKSLSTGYELDYLRDAAQYLGLTDCEI